MVNGSFLQVLEFSGGNPANEKVKKAPLRFLWKDFGNGRRPERSRALGGSALRPKRGSRLSVVKRLLVTEERREGPRSTQARLLPPLVVVALGRQGPFSSRSSVCAFGSCHYAPVTRASVVSTAPCYTLRT